MRLHAFPLAVGGEQLHRGDVFWAWPAPSRCFPWLFSASACISGELEIGGGQLARLSLVECVGQFGGLEVVKGE